MNRQIAYGLCSEGYSTARNVYIEHRKNHGLNRARDRTVGGRCRTCVPPIEAPGSYGRISYLFHTNLPSPFSRRIGWKGRRLAWLNLSGPGFSICWPSQLRLFANCTFKLSPRCSIEVERVVYPQQVLINTVLNELSLTVGLSGARFINRLPSSNLENTAKPLIWRLSNIRFGGTFTVRGQ